MTTTCKTANFTFLFKPVTSSRPRFAVIAGRAMAYHAAPYKAWLASAAAVLKHRRERFAGPVVVTVSVFVKQPQKQTRAYPPFDLDNYVKGPLDALTKAGIWHDDEQVVRLLVTKQYDRIERTEVIVSSVALTFKE